MAAVRGIAIVVVVAVVLVVAGSAVLYLGQQSPSPSSTVSSQLVTSTWSSSSLATSTTTTSISTLDAHAVQVAIPYGGGENDDGATEYLPQVVTVVIGLNNTVVWTNEDLIVHQIISNTGVFYSGDLSTGQSYSFTFTQVGTYPYYCSYHPPMAGVVIVKSP